MNRKEELKEIPGVKNRKNKKNIKVKENPESK